MNENTYLIPDGNKIKVNKGAVRHMTINAGGKLLNTPTLNNNEISVTVEQKNGSPRTKIFDARTGIHKRTL